MFKRENFFTIYRYMPPVTPSIWKNTRLADRFSAVCPQRPPDIGNRTEALLEFPRGRLLYLEKLLPLLANQSEDCLYLNLYVPRTGKRLFPFLYRQSAYVSSANMCVHVRRGICSTMLQKRNSRTYAENCRSNMQEFERLNRICLLWQRQVCVYRSKTVLVLNSWRVNARNVAIFWF